jgi:hypothetical protein
MTFEEDLDNCLKAASSAAKEGNIRKMEMAIAQAQMTAKYLDKETQTMIDIEKIEDIGYSAAVLPALQRAKDFAATGEVQYMERCLSDAESYASKANKYIDDEVGLTREKGYVVACDNKIDSMMHRAENGSVGSMEAAAQILQSYFAFVPIGTQEKITSSLHVARNIGFVKAVHKNVASARECAKEGDASGTAMFLDMASRCKYYAERYTGSRIDIEEDKKSINELCASRAKVAEVKKVADVSADKERPFELEPVISVRESDLASIVLAFHEEQKKDGKDGGANVLTLHDLTVSDD